MIQQIETSAQLAYKELLSNNDSACKEHLVYIFNTIQQASSQLLRITDYKSVGFAYLAMLEGKMYQSDDVQQVMTDNAFYCLSKAIEKYPNDFTSKIYRLRLYNLSRKSSNELIICALEIDLNPMHNIGMPPAWMKARDEVYKMGIVDLFDTDKKLQEVLNSDNRKSQYEKMIQENFFGNTTIDTLKAEGRINIMKCIKWLESCYSEY